MKERKNIFWETPPVKIVCVEPILNVSPGTLKREKSWLLCDKCDYKTKSNKALRIHNTKNHSQITKEKYPCVWVWYDGV